MKQNNAVQGHPASVDAYIRHGWKLVPIPYGTKGPTNKGWNQEANTIGSAADLPPQYGIGLAHAYSGTMALDIDNGDQAVALLAEHGIDLNALYSAPDAVTVESGKPGHGKLLYALPLGLTLPSKKITFQHEGTNQVAYELRCATTNGLTVQDVLPPSMHPETRQPYSWGGKGHWSRLPVIPIPLLEFWQTLVNQDQERTISDGTGVDASWDDIRAALEHIPPSLNRDDWIDIGMALHWAGQQTDQLSGAFLLWDEWSAGSPSKYKGQRDLSICWRSFSGDGGITLGTLFKIAKDHGWRRPVPSAEDLFSGVKGMKQDDIVPPVDILAGLRTPAPDMPMDLWPTLLATRADEISGSVGCDPLVPLFAGLAAVTGAADARIRLELAPGYRVPPVLWLMTLGDPADKKTPGSRPMMSVLRELEKEDRPRFQQAMLEWEAKEAVYASAHKAYIEHYTSAEAQMDNDVAPEVPDLPPQPVPVKITVEDITSQKLVRHAAERPRGLLCWLDEMNAWARKLTDPRSGEDRSAWVRSYESDSYEMDRVGAGSIWCENLAVSIYGNIQPRVFRQHIQNMANDGLVQRFLPAILRPDQTRLGNPIPDAFSSKAKWDQVVRTVYTVPEMTYTLSEDAYKVFREFQEWYETTKQDERILQAGDDTKDTFMTAFGKMEGQCGRLALVLHLIESPLSPQLTGELMSRAVAIVRQYIIPALRHAFGEVSGLSEDSIDAWMVNHVLAVAGVKDTLTLRDLKHSARRRLDRLGNVPPHQKDYIITDAMQTLERCHWVALVENEPRRNHVVWQINPNLVDVFKEQRVKILKVKQKRLDEIQNTSAKKGPRRFIPGYDPKTMD